jgi:hypothetical protein
MRKVEIIAVLSLVLAVVAAVPALAVGPTSVTETGGLHVCEGSTLDVEATKDDTAFLTGTGEVCGAGTGGTVTLSADVEVVTGCINPGSKQQQPKGLQRTVTAVVGTAELTITRPGRGDVDVDTNAVSTAGRTCPGHDTPVLVSATFTNIKLTVTSGPNKTITATFPDIDP